jgi:hypothetical protein
LGIDALSVAGIAPNLIPVADVRPPRQPVGSCLRWDGVLNAAARQALSDDTLQLSGLALQTVRVAGRVSIARRRWR